MEPRDFCMRCRRPRRVCFCDALTPVDSRTHVVFIQHPRESKVPISTCRMAHLSLPNSEMHVALQVEGEARLEALVKKPGTAVLFPGEESVDVEALTLPPQTLIVVDGTWSNARKVVERSPALRSLPRIGFRPERPGNYRIRKEPDEHCLSTIEAVAYVLEKLEQAPGRFVPVLKAFDAMVEKQLAFISSRAGPSRYKKLKTHRQVKRVHPLEDLRAKANRLVLLYAEGNAWPREEADCSAMEAIEWSALRLNGERFEAVVQPKRKLGAQVAAHVEREPLAYLHGEARELALQRWHGFSRPDDIVVSWGRYPLDLLAREGWEPAQFLNLRRTLAQLGIERDGGPEALAERWGAAVSGLTPRTVRRMHALEVIVRGVIDGSRLALEGLRVEYGVLEREPLGDVTSFEAL